LPNIRRLILSTVFALLLCILPFKRVTHAQAATATGGILVTTTVLSFCTIVTLPLAFPTYTSVILAGTTTLTVSCTAGTPYNIGLDLGVGTGATIAARKMTFLTSTLNYNLYSDTNHTIVWGPTIATNTVVSAGTGLPQVFSVFGQIPAGQLVAPGLYTDTVTATVTY
jgi:spore coat protein U-like protein